MPNSRTIILIALTAMIRVTPLAGQPSFEWDTAPMRSEFISYSIRDTAVAGDRSGERFFQPLEHFSLVPESGATKYTVIVDIPRMLLEREVFLHTEGGRCEHTVHINGTYAGSARDSRLPAEFNISGWLTEGANHISITVFSGNRMPEEGVVEDRPDLENIFLYSQPRVRIEDYSVDAVASPDGDGRIHLEIMVRNGYNYPEQVAIGYDVYSPDGKLQDYDIRNLTIAGQGADTLRLSSEIYGAGNNLWSAEKPNLYRVMLFVRRGGFVTEYIPVKAGFGTTGFAQGGITRNGALVDIKPVRYNASEPRQAAADILAFRKRGMNTVYVDYPQPHWFYDICDREGMYVVDQANINTPREADNLARGGTLSNDPAWLNEYALRVRGMYMRSRNHPCVIGWSTGGESGNGYNMQKAYLLLKSLDPRRPVVYRWAGGQWNSDLQLPAEVQNER